jgi:hypothetical protein
MANELNLFIFYESQAGGADGQEENAQAANTVQHLHIIMEDIKLGRKMPPKKEGHERFFQS